MSTFSNFAVCFSYVSPMTGITGCERGSRAQRARPGKHCLGEGGAAPAPMRTSPFRQRHVPAVKCSQQSGSAGKGSARAPPTPPRTPPLGRAPVPQGILDHVAVRRPREHRVGMDPGVAHEPAGRALAVRAR